MTDVVSYFTTFGAETAAALFGKLYDPVAWCALIGALLLGSTISRGSAWMVASGWGVLALAVLTLEGAYRSPVTRGDSAALALICLMALLAAQQVAVRLRRRSK